MREVYVVRLKVTKANKEEVLDIVNNAENIEGISVMNDNLLGLVCATLNDAKILRNEINARIGENRNIHKILTEDFTLTEVVEMY